MQKLSDFLLTLLIALVISCFFSNYMWAQKAPRLQLADSLFKIKKYTESFDVYDKIFQQGEFSPAMLLKMAFIKEGLNDNASALYYLDFYFKQTSDLKVLNKMEELAEKNELQGYQSSDLDFFISVYNKQRQNLIIIFSLMAVLMFAIVFRQKKQDKSPFVPAFIMLLVLGCLFYTSNFNLHSQKGIVFGNKSYLMKGPSSGSEPITLISEGHKVKILKSGRVWSKIVWNENEAYIRSSNLKNLL